MLIDNLISDLSNICESYLTEEEQIYVNNEWNKFDKKYVCNIAAENGWLDLLKWARKNGCDWNVLTCEHAAENGHLEVQN